MSGVAPAGPEQRLRPAISLRGVSRLCMTSALSATDRGFSLHAATTASADDAAGREALCKWHASGAHLRPPLAQERLHLLDGLVRVELKRAFSDGTVAIDMDPLSLLCRLAAAAPPPRFHVLRYAGVLAAAHELRSLVVPPCAVDDKSEATNATSDVHAHSHARDKERPATHRCQ